MSSFNTQMLPLFQNHPTLKQIKKVGKGKNVVPVAKIIQRHTVHRDKATHIANLSTMRG
jgi:hypothetical protein